MWTFHPSATSHCSSLWSLPDPSADISFVSCGAYMASVLPVQFTIGLAAGLPAWDMFLVFLMCGVMGAILTHYANAAGPVLFGGGYVSVKTLVAHRFVLYAS